MATEVKRRRGTTIEHSTFTGAVAELTVDLTKDTVVVHDGATQGGFPLLREDFSNVPTTAPFTNISLDTAIFDTTYTKTGSETQGTLYWNSDEETLSLVTNGESIELGQKVEIHVKNQTGAQINKGEVVYASGTLGASGRILVNKMKADGTVAAKRVLGVAAENIANGADGKVIKFGKLRQINTSTFSNGDILWVSTTTAGGFQNTEPVQANGEISLPIAYVVYSSASVGEIFVRVTPIDENEYTNYTDYVELRSDVIENHLEIESLQDNKVELGELFPDLDKQALGTGDSVTFGGLTVNGDISVTGTVDGRDVAADGADLDELYTTIGLSALTSDEVDQLENINSVTISNTQWGYLGALDQSLTTTSDVQFDDVTASGIIRTNEIDAQADLAWNTATEVFSTSDFYVNNAVNIGSNVYITDELDVAESLTVGTTLDVGGNSTLLGTLSVSGATSLGSTLSVTSNATVGGTLTLSGSADFNSTMNLQGNLTTQADLQDDGFSSGWSGTNWKIGADGSAEFEEMRIRGALRVYEFIAKQISTIGGSEILSIAQGRIASVNVGADVITVENVTGTPGNAFKPNDLWICQVVDINNDLESGGTGSIVKSVRGTVDYVSGNDIGVFIDAGDITELEQGDLIIAYGNVSDADRQAIMYRNVDRSEDNLIMRLQTEVNSFADLQAVGNTRVAFGDLNGYSELSTETFGFFAGKNANEHVLITDTGIFFKDGSTVGAQLTANEFKIGDSNNNLTFNTNTGAFNIKIGDETDLAASVAEIRQDLIDIYLADQSTFAGIQFLSGQITLKVGADGKVASARLDATGDESAITLRADFFDFQSNDIVLIGDPNQDAGTEAKIALGSNVDTITVANTDSGFIASGAGEFKGYINANNYLRLNSSGLDIKAQTFNLESSTIQLGDSIELSTSEITTTYDYTGSALVFSGLFNNTYNYFGYLEDIDDINPDGYVFRVGDATNFMELNTSNNVAKIKFDTFDLTSGNLRIKSVGTTYPSASANTEVTTADVTDFRIATLGSGFDTNSLAISNNRWVKFQFDYSQSVPGSFTAGITVTLEVSTDNSTFTDYGLFSDTRIDFNTNYFVADNATGNRLNVVDLSDSTKTSFRFKSSQTSSCSGTITMYFYVNEKDTTTHLRFNVLDSAGNAADSAPAVLTGASATNIGTRDYNPVTELNPSGIFTRLSDSLILSNGNTYIDYSLIT